MIEPIIHIKYDQERGLRYQLECPACGLVMDDTTTAALSHHLTRRQLKRIARWLKRAGRRAKKR